MSTNMTGPMAQERVLPGASLDADSIRERQLERATTGFESVFLNMLLEPLKEVGKSFFGSGPGSQVFAGLFRQHLADTMSHSEPLGVGKLVRDSLEQKRTGVEDLGALDRAGAEIGAGDEARASLREWMARQSYGKESR